jgi:YHS domain-containing protein
MPPSLPQWRAALVKAPATEADAHGPMPLGLEGYCPVTVVERGNWVEGRPQWGARHRGRTYLFAGPEQQKAFLADPDRYAPALSGDDPVLAFENGKSEPGRRAFGVSYQSRMYLFSSPETRAAFTAEPDRYTSRVLIAEGLAPADGIRRF